MTESPRGTLRTNASRLGFEAMSMMSWFLAKVWGSGNGHGSETRWCLEKAAIGFASGGTNMSRRVGECTGFIARVMLEMAETYTVHTCVLRRLEQFKLLVKAERRATLERQLEFQSAFREYPIHPIHSPSKKAKHVIPFIQYGVEVDNEVLTVKFPPGLASHSLASNSVGAFLHPQPSLGTPRQPDLYPVDRRLRAIKVYVPQKVQGISSVCECVQLQVYRHIDMRIADIVGPLYGNEDRTDMLRVKGSVGWAGDGQWMLELESTMPRRATGHSSSERSKARLGLGGIGRGTVRIIMASSTQLSSGRRVLQDSSQAEQALPRRNQVRLLPGPVNHDNDVFSTDHETVTFVVRFLVMWEAVEHAGMKALTPVRSGTYDTKYLDYISSLLSMLPQYGMIAFVAPPPLEVRVLLSLSELSSNQGSSNHHQIHPGCK
ncbi:hypothetical protein ARMGADRAFT_1038089 [Armillaria gallica]|uniref:Uncharacterized protein n=1 Tax=Armillaria gallica TaxID=47427 RepID=A0A2H3D261_ARMGA|nr:hypothetical protein ARMGADRAFT_1038089 [Armillaria gallica]